jgi:hypothetical protein
MVVDGALPYFAARPVPQRPDELAGHDCMIQRLRTYADCMPGSSKRMAYRECVGRRTADVQQQCAAPASCTCWLRLAHNLNTISCTGLKALNSLPAYSF